MKDGNSLISGGFKLPFTLSANSIKMIALITMLIDHLAATVLTKAYYYVTDFTAIGTAYELMRGIGRLTFPIFCFFVVEGLIHTGSRLQYMLRLLIFAIIAEPAFDLAMYGVWMYSGHQNVIFTLLLAVAALTAYDEIYKRCFGKTGNAILSALLGYLPVAAAAYLAMLFSTDYSLYGVLAVAVMYIHRDYRLLAVLAGVALTVLGYGEAQIPALLAVPILLLYNGQKGKGMKYLFYIFYPAHLAILYVASQLLRYYMSISVMG